MACPSKRRNFTQTNPIFCVFFTIQIYSLWFLLVFSTNTTIRLNCHFDLNPRYCNSMNNVCLTFIFLEFLSWPKTFFLLLFVVVYLQQQHKFIIFVVGLFVCFLVDLHVSTKNCICSAFCPNKRVVQTSIQFSIVEFINISCNIRTDTTRVLHTAWCQAKRYQKYPNIVKLFWVFAFCRVYFSVQGVLGCKKKRFNENFQFWGSVT